MKVKIDNKTEVTLKWHYYIVYKYFLHYIKIILTRQSTATCLTPGLWLDIKHYLLLCNINWHGGSQTSCLTCDLSITGGQGKGGGGLSRDVDRWLNESTHSVSHFFVFCAEVSRWFKRRSPARFWCNPWSQPGHLTWSRPEEQHRHYI